MHKYDITICGGGTAGVAAGYIAAKYGLISTLLGLGPMPGILLGALFPQKKKDPDREPSKLEEFFGGSSKKGKFIGGLTGLAFGGIPGMLIGGMLGGKLIGRKRNKGREYTKNDWDVRNELVYDPETGEVKVRERSKKEIKEYLGKIDGVSLGSDAFFPFGDNITRARASGVKYVAEPGGSIRDSLVIEECDKNGMVMAFTGMRLFHH